MRIIILRNKAFIRIINNSLIISLEIGRPFLLVITNYINFIIIK